MKPEYSRYLKHPRLVFAKLLQYASPLFPNDKMYLSLLYRLKIGARLNWDHPQSYTAKLQWMKLYYYKDNPLVYQCADKYRVREYVKDCGLEHILNGLIASYKSPEEINWDVLPSRFVLKWNFGCGGNVICFDKDKLDKEKAIRELKVFQNTKAHLICAEPQYQMEKVLLCEDFIEAEDGGTPTDYKFYCFNGEAKYVLCCYGRSETQKPSFYFFDRNWELQRFNKMGKEAPEGFTMPKPEGIDDLFHYAEALSKPFPFVRADFYLEKGKAYFGELTFTPGGGFDTGRLPETQVLFGNMVSIPHNK